MALNIDNKKTVLNDDAVLYDKKDNRNEKMSALKRFLSLHGEDRKQFFFDYMFKPLLIGGIILTVVIYFVVSAIINRSTTRFYVSCINPYYLDNDTVDERLQELAGTWNLKKHEKLEYTTGLALNSKSNTSTFITFLEAGSIDAAIGTKEQLEYLGEYFNNLGEVDDSILEQIPKEALCELTYEKTLPGGKKEIETRVCGVYLKYTVFADCIADEKLRDDLIVVLPMTATYGESNRYRMDFFKFLFGIE